MPARISREGKVVFLLAPVRAQGMRQQGQGGTGELANLTRLDLTALRYFGSEVLDA
jgi:hypothetical protein